MLPDAHRQAAEDIEATVTAIQQDPRAARMVIEGCWGAVFHWIAYGTQTKHGQHHDHHSRLGSYLRQLGESTAATWWEGMDNTRQGGFYGQGNNPGDVARALTFLRSIRTWAIS